MMKHIVTRDERQAFSDILAICRREGWCFRLEFGEASQSFSFIAWDAHNFEEPVHSFDSYSLPSIPIAMGLDVPKRKLPYIPKRCAKCDAEIEERTK